MAYAIATGRLGGERMCGREVQGNGLYKGFDKRSYPAAQWNLGPDPVFSGRLSIHEPRFNGYSVPIGVGFDSSQFF
jgi:hypothetical protein